MVSSKAIKIAMIAGNRKADLDNELDPTHRRTARMAPDRAHPVLHAKQFFLYRRDSATLSARDALYVLSN